VIFGCQMFNLFGILNFLLHISLYNAVFKIYLFNNSIFRLLNALKERDRETSSFHSHHSFQLFVSSNTNLTVL